MDDLGRIEDEALVDMNDARPRRWGWWLVVVGFGGFLTWALLAPLDAGVSAAGSVVVTGNRKAVQPLVAGKVSAILVKDGDEVTRGQPLVRLDDTQSRSQLNISKGQWFAILATQARLTAEREGRSVVDFPVDLKAEKADLRAAAAMTLQAQLMGSRKQALRSELSAMLESLRGLELQMKGTEASRNAKENQMRLASEQLKNQRELAQAGFLPTNRVMEQERSVSALLGAIAEDSGNLGRASQSIAEIRARMAAREQDSRKEIEAQLSDVQRDASALKSRLEALQFDVANTEIASPVGGVVMGLAVHTVGGVVAAGAVLMEVVPKGEPLRIEVQIPPHLIDKVKAGTAVDVLFPALNQVTTPKVAGVILTVSADVLLDQKQNLPFFKAVAEVTASGMLTLKSNEIRAGMPVEVFVRTGERTAMNYFLKPLLDRLNRALTEP